MNDVPNIHDLDSINTRKRYRLTSTLDCLGGTTVNLNLEESKNVENKNVEN